MKHFVYPEEGKRALPAVRTVNMGVMWNLRAYTSKTGVLRNTGTKTDGHYGVGTFDGGNGGVHGGPGVLNPSARSGKRSRLP